jgi:hypothetical protein
VLGAPEDGAPDRTWNAVLEHIKKYALGNKSRYPGVDVYNFSSPSDFMMLYELRPVLLLLC